MNKNNFAVKGKLVIPILSLAAMLLVLPGGTTEKRLQTLDVRQEIRKTLQDRVKLLDQLAGNCEKQYKNGSLDGNTLLEVQADLYVAKLLLMKAEAGFPAEPGIACAAIRFYAASYETEMRQRFSSGNLSLFLLLNSQLKANAAQLKYLNLLSRCKQPEAIEKIRRQMGPSNPAFRLEDHQLRELLNAEIQAQ